MKLTLGENTNHPNHPNYRGVCAEQFTFTCYAGDNQLVVDASIDHDEVEIGQVYLDEDPADPKAKRIEFEIDGLFVEERGKYITLECHLMEKAFEYWEENR